MMIQGFTPAMMAPVMGKTASASAASGSSTGSTTGSSTDLQNTFLNLLVMELKNQDPTAPVDPTAMVGQMVSLNELDQLISINQLLKDSLGSGASTTTPAAQAVKTQTTGSVPVAKTPANPQATAQPAASVFADPTALMNLYGTLPSTTSNISSSTLGGK